MVIYGIVLCKNTHNTNTAFYDYQILKFVIMFNIISILQLCVNYTNTITE